MSSDHKEVMDINRLLLLCDILYGIKLKINPEDYALWGKIGIILAKADRDEEALNAHKEVVRIKPDSYEAWGNKGVILFYLGHYEEALKAYNKALEINPNVSQLWTSKFTVLAKLNRQEEALDALKKAIGINPKIYMGQTKKLAHSPFYSIPCKIVVEMNNSPYSKLEKLGENFYVFLLQWPFYNILYNIKLKMNPEDHILWVKKGIILAKRGHHEEALNAYDKALEVNPSDYVAWGNKGLILEYRCRYNEALDAYNKALEIEPNAYEVWGNKGLIFNYLGRYEEALNAYNKALEINPNIDNLWSNKSVILAKLDRYEEALNVHEKLMEINPDYYIGHTQKVITQAEIHRKAISNHIRDQMDAVSYIQNKISILPDKEQAWEDLIRLKYDDPSGKVEMALGHVYIHLSNKEQAFQNLRKFIRSEDSFERIRGVSAIGLAFPHVPNKEQAWQDIHVLTLDKNGFVRGRSASAIGLAFPYVLDKEQAWQDIHKLTQDKEEFVRVSAAFALIDIFPNAPDKEQAWQHLYKLIQEENRVVRLSATRSLGYSFPYIPDKKLAQEVLYNLAQDKFSYSSYNLFSQIILFLIPQVRRPIFLMCLRVRIAANYSLGRASIFNATEAKNENVFKKELENAINFFKNSTGWSLFSDFPGDFCYLFYKKYYEIIFLEKKPDRIQEELLKSIRSLEYSASSESKEKLLYVLKNLADALIEIQVLGEQQNLETMKCDLNTYRQYCEHAVEIIGTMEEKTPYIVKLIQRGLPIIDRKIKEQLNEIEEASEYLCKTVDLTGSEIGCKIRKNVKLALEADNPIIIDQIANYILSDFKIWSEEIKNKNERDYIQKLIKDAGGSEIAEKLLQIRTLIGRVLHFSNSEEEEMSKYKIDRSVVNIYEKDSNFIQNTFIGSEKDQQTSQSPFDIFFQKEQETIGELAQTFSPYLNRFTPINEETIKEWLLQFGEVSKIKLAFKLLKNVDYYSPKRMRIIFVHFYENVINKNDKDKIVISLLGNPKDSSSIVNYILGEELMNFRLETHPLETILNTMNPEEKVIVFIDDNIGSGKQAIQIFREWMGIEERELNENHVRRLSKEQIENFKSFKIYLFTFVGLEGGKGEVHTKLSDMGLNVVRVYSFTKLEEEIGCFHKSIELFSTNEEREIAKNMVQDIAIQFFQDKDWPEELKKERSLGYGNSQKLIVFFYNTPTSTLPIFWKKGNCNGKEWKPLFPRREKK